MSWIQTYSGRVFEPHYITDDALNIVDIAHALSMICRFNGHSTKFYSVAEHCVIMSEVVDPLFAYEALMHDAAEAYIGDLARPLKPMVNGFREMEAEVDRHVRKMFGVSLPSLYIKEADMRMLMTEQAQVMSTCRRQWEGFEGLTPYPVDLPCWSPPEAKAQFLKRFKELAPQVTRSNLPSHTDEMK